MSELQIANSLWYENMLEWELVENIFLIEKV